MAHSVKESVVGLGLWVIAYLIYLASAIADSDWSNGSNFIENILIILGSTLLYTAIIAVIRSVYASILKWLNKRAYTFSFCSRRGLESE